MKYCFRIIMMVFLFLCWNILPAQKQGSVKGRVFDEYAKPIDKIRIAVEGTDKVTFTDSTGAFSMKLNTGDYILIFTHIDYKESRAEITITPSGSENVQMKMIFTGTTLNGVNIYGNTGTTDPNSGTQVVPIAPEMPTINGSIESRLTGLGAVINNEFSSQYRVRGGNFDENLVYVNDIEIYRPFLIRSGQQEGLSFVNPNLVKDVGFSSGGFQAKYGDRLSSVLDVTYKDPDQFRGTVDMGIITNSISVEGRINLNHEMLQIKEEQRKFNPAHFTFLVGGRRFTPAYVLGSLDTKGNYQPTFHDLQGMFTFVPKQANNTISYKTKNDGKTDTIYRPKERIKFTVFGNFADNQYLFRPESRETSFGTIQSVLRLRVGFEGREVTSYQTITGAAVFEFRPNVWFRVKHIFSTFSTVEAELFDVEGGYYLSDVNTNFGGDGYNETVFDRGVGSFYRHARNYLHAQVIAFEQKGDWYPNKNFNHRISWGLRVQEQIVNDELQEWNGVDSSGYFVLQESYNSSIRFQSHIFKAYVQDHWKISKDESKRLIFGARFVYNDLSGQMLIAPRVQFVIDPTRSKNTTDVMASGDQMQNTDRKYQLRFAAGVYQQPTFYREMRSFDGTVNLQRKAQVSYHFIVGGDYLFKVWGRPFRIFAEGYYKQLDNLVPYEVENVRVRYYPFNTAWGYAYGIDTRLVGEFIKGVNSWFSLGLLKTQEDVIETSAGLVPRPSDQRLTFGMYFQDELPMNPTYKVHINFIYGSGLKFGPPHVLEGRSIFNYPSYQRCDIGFSKIWVFNAYREKLMEGEKRRGIESLWLSFEVFNLFQRSNTVSYTWVKDVFNTQFAVPNYLSSRLLNIRATIKF